MAEYKLALKKRTLTGKKLKSLRAEGLIPSVIYGGKSEPILAASEYNSTDKVVRAAGHHSPVDLDIEGKKQLAIIKNVDVHPTSRRIVNIEFRAISAKAVVEAAAPIKIINFEESEAHKLHYAFLQVLEEIDVKAKPSDLPSELNVDASKLATLEDKLTIADIVLPEGVEFANKELDLSSIVANVFDPVAEAAAREAKEAAEAAATAEAAEAEGEGEESAEEGKESTGEENTEKSEESSEENK
ncbi:50S ribosomal protein L25 [Candidatus Saccharibacteria bacterium]|nr:50S ribosomal protein L25 [Candidatus Saccharibacteria bacterium]